MNFSCLSAEEVRTRYRLADDKSAIITVLADLTCCSKTEMRRFLGMEKPKRKRPGKLDEAKAEEYYEAGMTDQEIGQLLGVSQQTVCKWRLKNGMVSKRVETQDDSEKARLELWEQGLNDQEIGDALHLHPATVCSWRIRRGLPANVKQGQYDRRKMKG